MALAKHLTAPEMPLPAYLACGSAAVTNQAYLKAGRPFHDLDQAEVANSAVKSAFSVGDQATTGNYDYVNNPDIPEALKGVIDPEIGA